MLKVHVFNIDWDVDVISDLDNLPESFYISVKDEESLIDTISDKYGFCVVSCQYDIIEDDTKGIFIDDLEKMCDLLEASMAEDTQQAYDDFLNSYSYLTQNELDDTIKEINGISLAYLLRQAENANIEEMNGRPTGLAITSEQAKTTITNYVYNSGLCSKADIKDFEEVASSMAC